MNIHTPSGLFTESAMKFSLSSVGAEGVCCLRILRRTWILATVFHSCAAMNIGKLEEPTWKFDLSSWHDLMKQVAPLLEPALVKAGMSSPGLIASFIGESLQDRVQALNDLVGESFPFLSIILLLSSSSGRT